MKKFMSILMTLIMVLTMTSVVFANGAGPSIGTPPTQLGALQTFGNSFLGFVQWIGYAIAIGMLIYVGVKYTMASANEKADLKAGLVKYVIGAILIGGASAVAGLFFSLGSSIS